MFSQADSANSDASTTGSWRVQDSPRIGDFSSFPSSESQSSGVYGGYQYPASRGDYGMQPPLRSMSYGHIEPVSGSFQPPVSTAPLDYSRQAVPAQYTLASADANQTPTTTAMIDPAIAPAVSDSMSQYGGLYSPQWSYYQQNSQSVGMDYSRHDSMNMQWYHEEQNRQLQQRQHQQHWQHQHQHQQPNHLMPPPYNKGHQSPS